MTTLSAGDRVFADTCTGMDGNRFTDDQTILDKLSDVLPCRVQMCLNNKRTPLHWQKCKTIKKQKCTVKTWIPDTISNVKVKAFQQLQITHILLFILYITKFACFSCKRESIKRVVLWGKDRTLKRNHCLVWNLLELALDIIEVSFGSSHILFFPHFITEAANRFCSRRVLAIKSKY